MRVWWTKFCLFHRQWGSNRQIFDIGVHSTAPDQWRQARAPLCQANIPYSQSSPQPSTGFPLWGICLRPKWLQLYCTCICTLNDIYKQKWSVISSKVYKQRLFKHPDMVTWCEAAIEKNPQSFFLFNSSLFTIRESCCHQLISLMWDLIPLIPFLSFTYMLLHCKEWIKSKMFEWLKRRESLQH